MTATSHPQALIQLMQKIIQSGRPGEHDHDAPTPDDREAWDEADAMDTYYGPEVSFIDEHPKWGKR